MAAGPHDAALTYGSYLALDELLGAQRPRSDEHDELLFIVTHQVYELWFKQVLHELAALQARLEAGDTSHALHTLRRIRTILKVVVAQIDVLETMTPRQFSSFRARLDASSGFQSWQFRELEVVLGLRRPDVLDPYPAGSVGHDRLTAALARPSLFDSFLRYLDGHGHPTGRVDVEGDGDAELDDVLLAVYREDAGAAQVAEALVDLDEGVQEWRYRHVQMVARTIGDKPGTGGSTGAEYLRSTLFHPAFAPLWRIRDRL